MSTLLERFAPLEPLLAEWAFPSEDERTRKRLSSTPQEFQAFYDAVMPRLDDLLAYLAPYQPGAVPEEALGLYRLALAFAEAAPHVEMYKGSAVVPNSFDARRFVAAHGERIDG